MMLLLNISTKFTLPLTDPVMIFGVLLFFILLIPILFGKINIPSIVGLIFSGVLIGPHGINLIDNTNAIELFSTIGLLYIMFIVGLELDINEFKANKNKSFIFGFLTYLVPLVVGYIACRYALDKDFLASLLIANTFATHTLVAYPIINKLGISKNKSVAVTVGATVIADTLALLALAVLMQGKEGDISVIFFVKMIGLLFLFSLFLFFLVPKISRWVFQKIESEKYITYVYILFMVFLSGFLAEVVGLEAIIGAFLVGIVLNPLIPQTSAIMHRIEFIGNSIFVPIFLISVGMLLDLGVAFTGTTTIIYASVLAVASILGKWLASEISGLLFKYTKSERFLMFGLTTSRAAATLAIALIGFRHHIIDENLFNATILLILFTCIISSFATQKAGKEIVIADNENIETKMGDFAKEKILVPIANPSHLVHHIEFALLMKDLDSPNPVHLLGVVANNEEAEMNIVNFRDKLTEVVNSASETDIDVEIITTIDDNPVNGILRTSREIMSNIVVLGWPGKIGRLQKVLGDDKVNRIITNTDKNLFICHLEKHIINHKRIVVVSPPLAEREEGFSIWLSKIIKLSQEISLPVLHIGHPFTQRVIKRQNVEAEKFSFVEFYDWSKPLSWCNNIREDDMLFLVSAHSGYISHISTLDNLPTRLEKRFVNTSKIVIYPKKNVQKFSPFRRGDKIFMP